MAGVVGPVGRHEGKGVFVMEDEAAGWCQQWKRKRWRGPARMRGAGLNGRCEWHHLNRERVDLNVVRRFKRSWRWLAGGRKGFWKGLVVVAVDQ